MSREVEAIRAAFAVIAEEAPDGRQIRGVLAGRARTARQRRVVLRLAGAGAAAVAVGGAALGAREVLDRRPGHPDVTVPGGPGGGWIAVPWRFRPGWLPGGYGETGYSMMVAGTSVPMVGRTWGSGDSSVTLTVGWHEGATPPTGRWTGTVVDGVAADLIEDDYNALVTWQPAGQPKLTVGVGGDRTGRRNQALKVARSLRHDAGHGYVGPRLPYLPPAYEAYPWLYVLAYEGRSWYQSLVLNGDNNGMAQISVTIGPHVYSNLANPSTAIPLTVRGLPGLAMPTQNEMYVGLADGRGIHALGGLDGAGPQVLRLVNELDPGPVPDMTWVGSR